MAEKTPESRVKIVTTIFLVIAILGAMNLIANIVLIPTQSAKQSFDALYTTLSLSLILSAVIIFGYFFTYISLKKMQPWARRLALWVSVVLCFSIIGIIVTWYIWKQLGYPEVKALFGDPPAQRPQAPVQPPQ